MEPTPAAETPEWKSTACILCECNCGIEVAAGRARRPHVWCACAATTRIPASRG